MFQFVLSTLRAGFRNRVFLAVFVFGLLLVGVAFLSASFSPRQPRTVALDVGFSGLRFTLVLFAVTLIQDQVALEIERRSVVLTLSYPVNRAAYVLGRYFGIVGLIGLAVLVLGLLLWVAVMASGAHYEQQFRVDLGAPYWLTLAGIWLDVAVVAAFSLWIATLSTVAILPLALGTMFAIGGRALGAVFDYVAQGADGQEDLVSVYGPILDVIRWILPDLSRLDWRAWSMYAIPIDTGSLVLGVGMALCYGSAMLALAVHVFGRREFS